MERFIQKYLPVIAWALGIAVTAAAVGVWGSALQWDFAALTPYQVFPLFGLLAFSLMWTHYVIWALRIYSDAPAVSTYSRVTWFIVLVSLLAHPMIFHTALINDGLGLPPRSYAAYVGETFVWAVLLGTAAWVAFIAYETKGWFQSKSWWRYVLAANALAMLVILVHSLTLGQHLQDGWYRVIWVGYGVVLVVAYGYLLAKGKLFASA